MKKQDLRILFKQKRKELSLHLMEKLNDLILINFQKIQLPSIDCVHTYLSSFKLGEPETANIIKYLQFKNPLIKVAIPKVDIHAGHLAHYQYDEEIELITNQYGIDEPKEGFQISENEIDLVLIPLLAFDKKGYRVGFGKGYYDKFLARCRKDVLKVGLSYFGPVEKIEDITGYDIPMDFCITPKDNFIF
ncbi:MAG: 5-formyltetrahydrofolate cyclo-ligase [Ginsengibacter sp.]